MLGNIQESPTVWRQPNLRCSVGVSCGQLPEHATTSASIWCCARWGPWASGL